MNAPTSIPFGEQRWAYVLLRAFVGLDFFGHGYARIFTGTYLSGFVVGMQHSMASAPLDPRLVLAMGYVIPVVEVMVGAVLLLGWMTRWAVMTAFGLMFVLMFGVTMKQDWTAAGQQLVYGAVLAALLFLRVRYDGGWLAVFRGEGPARGPVVVPARIPGPNDSVSPLGRS